MTQSTGWNATVELERCGGSLVLRSGGANASVTSPRYPDLYPADSDCEWRVRAPRGHFVHAYVDHLWFASANENCSTDRLEIRDESANGTHLQV